MSQFGLVEPERAYDPVTGLDLTAKVALEALSEAHDLKQWDKAAAVGDAWVHARGEMPLLASILYAQSLMGIGRVADALPWASAAFLNMPESEPTARCAAASCYGQALARAGRFTESRRVLKQMTQVKNAPAEAREKQGHVLMAISDKWREGWALHESRLDGRALPPGTRLWDGVTKEPVAVLHEQGIGDAVLFARWLPWLAEATGSTVTWYGPKLLHRWIEGLGVTIGGIENDQIVAPPGGIAAVYAMSLPHYAGVRSPLSVPHAIAPDEFDLMRHRRHLARRETVRVGVCWQGASSGWHDFERSYSLDEFCVVVKPCDGVEFVNLAHEAEVPLNGWPFMPTAFGDVWHTAEAIASCDLVVSVDTSIVHLAGSIGVTTVALAPTVPDWRYEWPYGTRTPFYSSVSVIRRRHGADLSPLRQARTLIERFAKALAEKVA